MKKILIILAAISCLYLISQNETDYIVIPKDSIRFRIIPNSNTLEDLNMKEKVKNEISSVISAIETSNDIETSRKSIKENIPIIENKITTLFKKNNYDKTFNVKYGLNYFPEKTYKGIKYEAGDYESMVIEIGSATGSNYWCVLFPPLCMIDAKETNEVEYKFFVSEIINKFIKK